MKAIVLVIDGFGIGALPDASTYDDEHANTIYNICNTIQATRWNTLQQMGLGNAAALLNTILPGCETTPTPIAQHGIMAEKSPGKDTVTGHWEIAGIIQEKPLHVFQPEYPSIPIPFLEQLSKITNYSFIGNYATPGTTILNTLGDKHLQTGRPIIYTSSDSVIQIAAHENIISTNELYRLCKHARKLANSFPIGRIIARPFTGSSGNYTRTSNRKDFAISPPENILHHLQQYHISTIGVGKIGDIFTHSGLDKDFPDKGNQQCIHRINQLIECKTDTPEFIFVNLVDTDMLFGHRRDVRGFHDEVAQIDLALTRMINQLTPEDLIILTADHGCDPTYKGTDHTREYVPLLVYQKGIPSKDLGIRSSFADIAASLADFFNIPPFHTGNSFLNRNNTSF